MSYVKCIAMFCPLPARMESKTDFGMVVAEQVDEIVSCR